jgi:hypothetical protein
MNAFNRFSSQPIELNRIRLTVSDADRGCLHVKSTCANTEKLDIKTDEELAFTDNDLIVIKNCREAPCELSFTSIRLPGGRRAILRPSRQAAQSLMDKEVSEVRSRASIRLGGGEALTIVSSSWAAGRGQGAGRLVVA